MKSKFSKFWREFLDILKRREMSILPAHLAYYFLLSTIPALALIFFIASSLNLSTDIISNMIESIFSPGVSEMIMGIINSTSLNLTNVTLFIIALFLTSNGARSIIIASNMVFNISSKGAIKRRIKSFMITVILIMLITFILVVPLFGTSILKIFELLNIDNQVTYVLNIVFPVIKWPLTLFVLFIFVKLLYTIAPDDKIPSAHVNKGSIFTTVSWSIIAGGYSIYINNFAAYDKLYGALSNIVILLFWFWLLSYVFVIGLALNYRNVEDEIEKTNTIKLKEIQDKVREKNHK